MKNKRIISIISTLLAILMLASSMSIFVSAAEDSSSEATTAYEYNTSKVTPTIDYLNGEYPPQLSEDDDREPSEIKTVRTQEEKLNMMDLRIEQNGFRMYVDAYSGEVAVQNIETGDVLFTNPYNVSSKGPKGTGDLTEDQVVKLLSQIYIKFVDTTNNDEVKEYWSFKDAVKGGDVSNRTATSQINVKYIQNGIRVEYSIGRIDTRYLVPERIKKKTFEEKIYNVAIEAGCSAFEKLRLQSFFKLQDLDAHLATFNNEQTKEEQRKIFLEKYPEAANGPIYVLTGAITKDYKDLEKLIKKYCPDFTYEDLDEAHLALNYTPKDKNEALFKIALEYTIDEKGLTVRMPANGIRFDESIYRVECIEILPYMGAGENPNSGYTFFPDGSGALFDFEELDKKTNTYFYGDVYGEDFAYYNVGTNSPHNQVVRYPVFGLKEDVTDWEGKISSRGYVAIIEEGDSMMTLYSAHGDGYNTVKMQINPRPYDQYKLSSAISVAGDAMWTVVSDRKYTGNVSIRYIMLTDEGKQTNADKTYYDTDYVGMAKAYRDHLVQNGVLTRLTEEDVSSSIPLYIETFGSIETTEKFLSVPYSTMKPLTSFGDVQKMYNELSGEGVNNINFILTGYTKGGLNIDSVPYNLKWEKTVEKDLAFEDLISDAKEKGYGVYPDFDFVFASSDKWFDGLTLSDHAVKTIDGRYTSKREYSATRQTFVSYFELAISPAYFNHFYEKLTENYNEYSPIGISVSSLASYLNSDFDEDEPYNREDSKQFTIDAFKYLDENYQRVLTSGGNAYSWKYVDYITDVATDSSRHVSCFATVPFLGIVLHGYVQTAGTPTNMEGNIDYAILRAIENGASLKFILSYRNTSILKEYSDTNIYYSVRYDIWVKDLVERYNKINKVLADVQTSTIESHEFIDAIRIPDADEALEDAQRDLMAAIEAEEAKMIAAQEAERLEHLSVRLNPQILADYINSFTVESKDASDELRNAYAAAYKDDLNKITAKIAEVNKWNAEKIAAADAYRSAKTNENKNKYNILVGRYNTALSELKQLYTDYYNNVYVKCVEAEAAKYTDMYAVVKKYLEKSNAELVGINFAEAEIIALKAVYATIKAECDDIEARTGEMLDIHKQIVGAITDAGYAENVGIVKVAEEVEEFNKYEAAQNSVVLEKFSNGKELVLNFNSYDVKVIIDGVCYNVEAYDFIVLREKGGA